MERSIVIPVYPGCREARLPGAGIPRRTATEEKPWGMREIAIVEPNGTLFRVGQATLRRGT